MCRHHRQGDTLFPMALELSAGSRSDISGGSGAHRYGEHAEAAPDSMHVEDDERGWSASPIDSETSTGTDFAAGRKAFDDIQKIDYEHPWLDPHYFTRPGEDPLSAFSHVFDASPQPERYHTARTHRRARNSKIAPYVPRPQASWYFSDCTRSNATASPSTRTGAHSAR